MSTPQLEQYPGYFPKGSKPFWTRSKVGVAAGVAGLLVGIAGGGSEAEPPAASNDSKDGVVQADLAEALEDKDQALQDKTELEDQLRAEEAASAKAVRQVKKQANAAQRKAVQAAVVKVRREEQRKAASAIQAAKTAAAASTPTTSPVAPLASNGGATDPQFFYCYEANDAGYGPYYSGQDPEYAWYDDRDGDGIVCET